MGNIVQRLTHRGGEFRLTQVNEAPSKDTPQITVTDDSSNLPQEDDLEPNGGDVLLPFILKVILFIFDKILREINCLIYSCAITYKELFTNRH